MTSLVDLVLDLDHLLMSCSYRELGLSVMEGLVVEGKCTRVGFGKLIRTFFDFPVKSVSFSVYLDECGAYVDGDYYLFQVRRRVGVKKKCLSNLD
jgi:hypothetical protein